MLAGLEEPDTGRVTRVRGLLVGHLAQDDRLSTPTPSATRSSATWPTTSGPPTRDP